MDEQRGDADTVLQQLLAGNARYVDGTLQHGEQLAAQRAACAGAQHPSAILLGCSDARVPPQLIFDQGPGEIFTVRLAGNIASEGAVASMEYAVLQHNVPLIIVLGHTGCGAVTACLHDTGPAAGHLARILEPIRPAVDEARGLSGDPLDQAIRINVRNSVAALEQSQPILAPRVAGGQLKVVGALYDLETGRVEMLEKPARK